MTAMTSVAEIRQTELKVGGEKSGRPYTHEVWTITWRGPCGHGSSGTWYRSKESAVTMARECGAKEIEFPAEAVTP
jgi:hypothetical protein